MKNYLLLLVCCLAFIASNFAQPFNTEIIQEEEAPQLHGKINKDALSEKSYGEWFEKNYSDYVINPSEINQLKNQLSGYTITLFLGTWCGDSKREVPKFYKILEEANFPLERLTTVALGREEGMYKKSLGGEEEGLNIHRVPTFIFYKNGEEVNRIVETPVETLEKDMLSILANDYVSNYKVVAKVHELLKNYGADKLQKKTKKMMEEFKEIAVSKYELSTYSYILLKDNKQEEAIEVARLNTMLFPDDAFVFQSLANKYYASNMHEDALTYYMFSLELDPENEDVKEKITELTSGS